MEQSITSLPQITKLPALKVDIRMKWYITLLQPAPIPSHLPLNLLIPQADRERLASQRRLAVPGPTTAMLLG
jgi:hypothetical protein